MAAWLSLRAAIQDLDLGEQEWADTVHAEARALLDEGLGAFVYSYRFVGEQSIRLGALAGSESAPGFWQALSVWGSRNQHTLRRIYRTGTNSLARAARSASGAGLPLSDPHTVFELHGVADVFSVTGHDPRGYGSFITVPSARHRSEASLGEQRCFERLATELAVATRLREHRRQARAARLSASELEVARLLTNGASDKYIAAELGLSLSTVSTFARRVRTKLGCRPGEERLLLAPRAGSGGLARRLALFDRLTIAECDIVADLLLGLSYADIAERRGVSVPTVAAQCSAAFHKCGVSGKRELAAALLAP